MRSLKELIAKRISQSERELNADEADFVLTVIRSAQDDDSRYEVEDGKLKHYRTVRDGTWIKEYVNGKIFKETEMYPNGNIRSESWLNRKGRWDKKQVGKGSGPARIEYYENGNKATEYWYQDGSRHRTQSGEGFGPAITGWYESGVKYFEHWYQNNELNREGFPAAITWYENGNKKSESWFRNGKLDRKGAPAVTTWYEDGNKKSESWLRNGEPYRENNLPYSTTWDIDGEIVAVRPVRFE